MSEGCGSGWCYPAIKGVGNGRLLQILIGTVVLRQVNLKRRESIGAMWWLSRRAYFLVFLREITSIFIAAYTVLLIILIGKLGGDKTSYDAYFSFFISPGLLVFHVVAFMFAVIHSITFFNLIPKGIAIRIGDRRVHPDLISASHYGAWVVVTGGVLLVVLV